MDELAGKQRPMSQVQAILSELGIQSISALSPQAKGRVERLWRTLQDRLTKELRVAGITSLADANRFLPTFIEQYNARFGVAAREEQAAWRAVPADFDPDYYFAAREERVVRADHTLQWKGTCLQIVPGKAEASLAGKRVWVQTTPDGAVYVYDGKRRLSHRLLDSSLARPVQARTTERQPAKVVDAQARHAARRRQVGWLFTKNP